MAKIYQAFVLEETRQKENDEKIRKEKKKDKNAPGIVPGRGEKLIQKLKDGGYNVLVSGTSYDDIPIGIIVGAERDDHNGIKMDFYAIIDELGLWFSSGNWYRVES